MTSARRDFRKSVGRVAALSVALCGLFVLAVGTDAGSPRQATDRALEALLLVALPLVVCVAIWDVPRAPSAWRVRFGRDRRALLLRLHGSRLAFCLALYGVLAALVIAFLRGPHHPRTVSDILDTWPVVLAGVLAWYGYFLLGQTLFGRVGLVAVLLLALLLRRTDTASLFLPAGHLRHLLGSRLLSSGRRLWFDPAVSMAILWGMALVSLGLASRRAPR